MVILQNNVEKQHLEFLKLEFYDRTRVLNTRVSKLANKNYSRGTQVSKTRVPSLTNTVQLHFFVLGFFIFLGFFFFFFIFVLFFVYLAFSSFWDPFIRGPCCLIFDWFGQRLANPRPNQSTTSVLHVFQFCVIALVAFFRSTPLFRSVAFFGLTFSSSDRSAFSTPNLCFSSSNLRFSDLIFQIVSSSSFGSVSSVLQILLKSKKLDFHVDKFLHLSTKTRVSEARFCHRTRVSKTLDSSFLHGFKTLLTNDILSPHYASLQISP